MDILKSATQNYYSVTQNNYSVTQNNYSVTQNQEFVMLLGIFLGTFATFPWHICNFSSAHLQLFLGTFATFPWHICNFSLAPLQLFLGTFATFPPLCWCCAQTAHRSVPTVHRLDRSSTHISTLTTSATYHWRGNRATHIIWAVNHRLKRGSAMKNPSSVDSRISRSTSAFFSFGRFERVPKSNWLLTSRLPRSVL